jgi:hypothetical protein
MSITYTVNDWVVAMKGVGLESSAPGVSDQSTTLTSSGIVITANGEFDALAVTLPAG